MIFIQPTYSTAIAQAIAAEINAEVAIVDPLAHDWLNNLEGVAEAFAAALENNVDQSPGFRSHCHDKYILRSIKWKT